MILKFESISNETSEEKNSIYYHVKYDLQKYIAFFLKYFEQP